MRRLLVKHPKGLDGFEGSLEPTSAFSSVSFLSENKVKAPATSCCNGEFWS